MHWQPQNWQWMQSNVPILCVDGVVITKQGEVLLTKRSVEPFVGFWHLPGGHVDYKEKLEEAVMRVVQEETGLVTTVLDLVGIYSDPNRDPRGHFVTIAYLLRPRGGELQGDFQSSELQFFAELPRKVGFDVCDICEAAWALWRFKFQWEGYER